MEGPKKFKVLISEEVDKFLDGINPKAKAKIFYNINLVVAGQMDKELFKKLEGSDIWEFRTLFSGIAYRLLSFFDTDGQALIITTHGFIKKTQKTPKKEIERAKVIRDEYFKQKRYNDEIL
ncbi:MAG: type II toxin-antitoxin system RelE/ParE family toxin [Muribaculaceae bacterium]|nr:type II toxin-antitoxin system RelE/ParE family toxin [Muribaculaceae bacterium]